MINAVFMLIATLPAANPSWDGTVTASDRGVVLHRQDHTYAARRGAGIRFGDELTTPVGGELSLLLGEDQIVYLGPETNVVIKQQQKSHLLHVLHGEARVTSGGDIPLVVRSGATDIAMTSGIVRVLSGKQSIVLVEHGRVDVRVENRSYQLTSGRQLIVDPNGQLSNKRTPHPWKIQLATFQKDAVEQARQLPPINGAKDDLAKDETKDPTKSDLAKDEPATQGQPGTAGEPNRQQPQNRGADLTNNVAPPVNDDEPPRINTPKGLGFSSLSLGFASLTSPSSASGGANTDANQASLVGNLTTDYNGTPGTLAGNPFPGNIHLLTAQSAYMFNNVQLNTSELTSVFGGDTKKYWSIGTGTPPPGQVVTDFVTGTNPVPTIVDIPRFDGYLVRLDQFSAPDPLDQPNALTNNAGITGLLGSMPTAPTITGATPLSDDRARMNQNATFALGEFRVDRVDASGMEDPNGNMVTLNVRSSDQDRTIVKDPGNNDALDQVTVNPDVEAFDSVADPRFQPQAPTVFVPRANSLNRESTRFSKLGFFRKAAATTLMADQLHDFSKRTGQTRFVVDGKILDITGYRKP